MDVDENSESAGKHEKATTTTMSERFRELLRSCNTIGQEISTQFRQDVDAASTRSPTDEFFLRNPKCNSLLPHQIDGVRWLMALFKTGVNGILADDMGLGKTVQVVAFLSCLYGHRIFGTHLVVVPLSTLENWNREFARWCPWCPIVIYHGDREQRSGLRDWLKNRYRHCVKHRESLVARSSSGEAVESIAKEIGAVVLTTYEMAMSDHSALSRVIPWDMLVIDEAHRLKNFNCRLIDCLRKFEVEGRLLLTGTPMQNNLKELWSIMNFILPELFQDMAEFQKWFEHAEVTRQEAPHAPEGPTKRDREGEEDDDEPGPMNALNVALHALRRRDSSSAPTPLPTLRSHFLLSPVATQEETPPPTLEEVSQVVSVMHDALRPFILRRTKAQIPSLKIPPKYDVVLYTPLTATQKEQYELVKRREVYGTNRMMHLRKVCCHPFLFAEFTPAAWNPDSVLLAEDPAVRVEHHSNSKITTTPSLVAQVEEQLTLLLHGSSKLAMLDRMLAKLLERRTEGDVEGRDGPRGAYPAPHKILLFSQMTQVLNLIELYLNLIQKREDLRLHASTLRNTRPVVAEVCRSSAVVSSAIPYVRLDGSCSMEERGESVRRFMHPGNRAAASSSSAAAADNDIFSSPVKRHVSSTTTGGVMHSPDVSAAPDAPPLLFLISTRSGGLGLNLVAADTVILYDGDFNPHNDQQAIDRCHRIGQTKPVVVYRLVAPSTVEDALVQIALRKKRLEKVVLDCGEFFHLDRRSTKNAMVDGSRPTMLLSTAVLSSASLAGDALEISDEVWKSTPLDRLLEALTMQMRFGDVDEDARETNLTDAAFHSLMSREEVIRLCGNDTVR
jgi:SNF2 family DNA or RNA helicase